ncbi:MAG: hypothetical protein FWB95_07375 [Treponema sp.]|nr:hypothetical protein [Treponema sp.]
MNNGKYWTYDEEGIMNKLGFSGYNDRTHGGLTFFLSLVFGIFTALFIYAAADELLIGTAIHDYFSDNTGNIMAVMCIAIIVSFIAVIWRHWPLIIIFILTTLIGIFNVVHAAGIEHNRTFPLSVREMFMPSEEKLAEIKAHKQVRFGRVKPTVNVKDIPGGAFVTITRNIENDKTKDYTVQYHNIESTWKGGTNGFILIRTDRTIKTIASGSLMSSVSPNADIIKEIPKGKTVSLTGGLSKNDTLLEVIYDGEKGWLAQDKLFMPLIKPAVKNFTTLGLVVIGLFFVLLYFLNFLRALNFNKIYRNEQIDYYIEKREKFPWLNRYLSKTGEPASSPVSGAFYDVNRMLLANVAIYALISVALGFLIHLFIFDAGFYGIGKYHLFNNVMMVMWIIGIMVIQIVWSNSIDECKYSNDTECPECGCPHGYDMIESENFLDEVTETSGETVKETTTTYSDGSQSTSTERTPYRYNTYHGHSYEKYYCFSCNIEITKNYENTWGSYPELGKKQYPKDKDKLLAQ